MRLPDSALGDAASLLSMLQGGSRRALMHGSTLDVDLCRRAVEANCGKATGRYPVVLRTLVVEHDGGTATLAVEVEEAGD